MKTNLWMVVLLLLGCTPTSEKYPASWLMPRYAAEVFAQSQHGDRPELCMRFDSNRRFSLRCDQGQRDFTRAPFFELEEEGSTSFLSQRVHLSNGRFANAVIGTSLLSPLFVTIGDAEPFRLTSSNVEIGTSWAYDVSTKSLWLALDNDNEPGKCTAAAVLFWSPEGGEKRACLPGYDGPLLHKKLPLLVQRDPSKTLMFYRANREAGTVVQLGSTALGSRRGEAFDLFRPVLFLSVGTSKWREVEVRDDDSLVERASPLDDLLYTIDAVEESTIGEGDTILSGVAGVGARMAAIVVKDGRPLARYLGPDQTVRGEFVQAGHELYFVTTTVDPESRAETVHIHKPVREALE